MSAFSVTSQPAIARRAGLRGCLRSGSIRLAALLLLAAGYQAQAATRTWDGGGADAMWDTLLNWDNNALPANGDTLVFGSAFTSGTNIDLNGNRTLQTLQISTLTGFSITNSTLTLNSGDITRSDIAGTEADQTISSNIFLGADGNWNLAGSGSLIVSGVVSGARKVTKNGAGALVLSAANTFSGEFSITAGTVGLGNNSAAGTGNIKIGAATIYADGTARMIGNTVRLDQDFTIGGSQDLTFTGDAVLARDIIITTDNTGLSTFSGSISGGHKLYKDGAGRLILSGANSHDETYVNAGVLNIRHATALSDNKKTIVYNGAALEIQGGIAVSTEPLELFGSGISNGGALRNVSGNNSWAGNLTLQSAATIASDSGTLTVGGNIINGGFAATFSGAGDVTASGVVSGTGTLTKSGAGILTLSGVNTYSGATTINGGTIRIGADSGLGTAPGAPTAGHLTFDGGTLNTTATFSLSTNRGISLASGGGTIDTNSGTTLTYAGIAAGTGALTKSGAGTLILTASNTYTGLTTVNAGTLRYGASNVIATGAVTVNGATAVLDLAANQTDTVGTVTVAGGGSITGTGTSALTSTGTFEMQSGSASAILAGTGIALNKTTSGTVTLTGANTYTGATTLTSGVLSVSSLANGGSASNIGSSTNAAANLVFDGGTLQYTGATAATDRNFTINTDKTATFDITANNLTVSGASTATNGALAKVGAGTLTLTGANTFTGNTTVSGGTLAANADGALGSTGKVTINTGGTTLLGATAGDNRIGNTAEVDLVGGTFNTGGFTETVGKMTLSGNSTFDFGAGTSRVTFDGLSSFGSSTLTVMNWTGVQWNAGGTDQLLFKNSSFTAGSTTSQVQFNIGGTLYNSIFIDVGSSTMELVPVPEPATIFGASALVLALGWRERKRVARLLGKRQPVA